jgi:HlyD family secretion protein
MQTESKTKARLKKGFWTLLSAIAGLGILVFAYTGLTYGLAKEEADVASGLATVAVERGDLRETVVSSATMEPYSRVLVKSEVSGVVRRVHVDEGDRVAEGQPMFDLERDRLEAALDLERAEFAFKLARVDLAAAAAELAARRASVTEAAALLSQARTDLDHAAVPAPIDGIVIEREVEIGSVIADVTSSGGTVLAIVADDRRIRLVAEVDENDIAPVRVGQECEVTLDAFPGETFTGLVRKVSSSGTVEQNVSSFEVEIELPEDPRLRVGMSADARIVVHVYRDVLLVPNTAIVRDPDGPVVRVPDAEDPEGERRVPIREVYSDGFKTVIDGGLADGDPLLVRTGSKT